MLECFLTTLEFIAFASVILGLELRKENIGYRICGLLLLCTAGGFLRILQVDIPISFIGVSIIIAWLNCYLLFEVKGKAFLKLILISYPCIVILENPFFHLAGLLFFENNDFKTMIAEISLILPFSVVFLLRKGKRGFLSFSDPAWRFFIIILWIMTFMMSYFQYVLEHIFLVRARVVGDLLFIGGSVTIDILIFAMIHYLNRVRRTQVELEFIQKYGEQQKEYFIRLLDREQDTKKFRHDISNQFMQLKSYCETGDYEKLQEFLDEMIEELHQVSGKGYEVGNEIVNVVLNYYFSTLPEEVTVSVSGYMREETSFSQRDLCVLFSNLVKNAAEAVGRCKGEKKEITLLFRQTEKGLSIHIDNTFETEELSKRAAGTVKEEKEQHGFGTQIIDEIVKKYRGDCVRTAEGEKYIVEIRFPA